MDFQYMKLIQEKDGISVYRGKYGGQPAVIKHFEKPEHRREMGYYQLLKDQGIPTLQVLQQGQATLVLEDVTKSPHLRLGIPADFEDLEVIKKLAYWYANLHAATAGWHDLNELYSETDLLTKENLEILKAKLPEGAEVFAKILANFERFQQRLATVENVLTYNDFYWTNLVVRQDKSAAFMFDYNMMGRGYRYGDIRNVCASLPAESAKVFKETYGALSKVGINPAEVLLDEVAAPLVTLIFAFQRDTFPNWAEPSREVLASKEYEAKVEVFLQGS